VGFGLARVSVRTVVYSTYSTTIQHASSFTLVNTLLLCTAPLLINTKIPQTFLLPKHNILPIQAIVVMIPPCKQASKQASKHHTTPVRREGGRPHTEDLSNMPSPANQTSPGQLDTLERTLFVQSMNMCLRILRMPHPQSMSSVARDFWWSPTVELTVRREACLYQYSTVHTIHPP